MFFMNKSTMNWFKRILIKLVFCLLLLIGYLWAWTLRFSFTNRYKSYHLDKNKLLNIDSEHGQSQSTIMLFWHNQFLIITYLIFVGKLSGKSLSVIISSSRDGDLLTYFVELMGCEVIRGSSHKGGVRALKLIHKSIEQHRHIIIAADGPTGPIYKVKPGAIFLSHKHDIPLLLLKTKLKWSIRLNTWDKSFIPIPFARVEVDAEKVFPQAVFKNATDASKESLLQEGARFIEDRLNDTFNDLEASN